MGVEVALGLASLAELDRFGQGGWLCLDLGKWATRSTGNDTGVDRVG